MRATTVLENLPSKLGKIFCNKGHDYHPICPLKFSILYGLLNSSLTRIRRWF